MLETIGVTAAAIWLWDKFGDDITDKAGEAAADATWKQIDWRLKEKKYLHHMRGMYSTTSLLGNPKQIDLSEIFTDVYVYDQVNATRRLSLDETGIKSSGQLDSLIKAKREPLLDVARKNKKLYVLGKPGAGKSTFLKKVVLEACDGRLGKTPIFVGLRAWADSKLSILEFVQREFEICDFPNPQKFVSRLLTKGNAVVLFDGLDEVNHENGTRKKVINALRDFSRTYQNCSITLTCRVAATDYSFEGFKYVEIADFTGSQQLDFVQKWYGESDRQKRFLEGWHAADSEGFRDLGKTPLLLALMCLAFDETLRFPLRRVDLYQEAFNALLRKWDTSRGISRDSVYKDLSHIRREQLLSRIAADMFTGRCFLIPRNDLENLVQRHINLFPIDRREDEWLADSIVQSIAEQHGLLVERAVGIYAFSHLTFQEYLTAKYIAENAYDTKLIQLVEENAGNDQWKEVILMVASLLTDGQVLFASLQRSLKTALSSEPRLRDIFVSLFQSKKFTASPRAAAKPSPSVERYRTVKELALDLAARHHYESGEEAVVHRARALAAALNDPTSEVCRWLGRAPSGNADTTESNHGLLSQYLRTCLIYCECLKLAIVADRDKLARVILAP